MNLSIEDTILDTIIQTSNNNITITDENGVILYTNLDHWAVYGVKADQYIGKSVYTLQEEGILSPSITAMVIKERRAIQIMQHTKTGKIIMSTAYPIFNDDKKLIRVISYAQDQTEIRNLQDQYEQLKRKIKDYQTEVEELRGKEGILYRSKEMLQILKTIYRVADSDATVLLLGESGVGKSMFARSLHNHSHRHKEPFIEVNCSTIPENLFESEMFGYESGSFTGAQKHGKQGLIEQAHNGTLFLDEIGELPLAIQVKLLKVIQEKKFTRIGGNRENHIDFRLVTATNRHLDKMVEEGKFRLDLYYRLNVIPILLPPLRERREDITLLINHYLNQMNAKYQKLKTFHSSTYEILNQYNWPGNVRELENLVERLVLTTEEATIHPHSLPPSMLGERSTERKETPLVMEEPFYEEHDLKTVLEKVEQQMILKAYKHCTSTYEMAKFLGISQPSVVRKLKKYKDLT